MDTFASARTACHARIRVTSERVTDFIDLTDRVAQLVADARVSSGFVNVQTLHTTTAIVVNEHEPLLLMDFEACLDRAAPRTSGYAHDRLTLRSAVRPDEPLNGHAHCRALLLPTSVALNISEGRLVLGRWQRVFFVDLDGPRPRDVSILLAGEVGL